jgi:hypothetical protein
MLRVTNCDTHRKTGEPAGESNLSPIGGRCRSRWMRLMFCTLHFEPVEVGGLVSLS